MINLDFKHVTVLANEAVDSLNIKPSGTYVDATLGGGGHSNIILDRLNDNGLLIAVDRDKDAIDFCAERFGARKNIVFIHDNYFHLKDNLSKKGIFGLDGVLLDLGVSSYQLDEPSRGFSYMNNANLDMRMDRTQSLTAFNVINEYSEEKLFKVIKDYGEERYAKRIAKNIVNARLLKPINTTLELTDIIKSSIPGHALKEKQHPAKRTFQAIRIEVNQELELLEMAIKDMIYLLSEKGRISIITFHSLEDRIVKNVFRELENPCKCPADFPVCMCGKKAVGKVITKKALLPGESEIEQNHRARSAKLRVFEKL